MEDPAPARTENVTIRYPKEVKTIVWRIEDFSSIMALNYWPSPPPSIQFDAGESIGMPSKWKVEIYPFENVSHLGMKLICVKHVEGDVAPKNVTCEAVVKSADRQRGNVVEVNLRPEVSKYFVERGYLVPAAVGEDLPIHLKFVMYGNLVTEGGNIKSSDIMSKTVRDDAREDVINNLGDLLETGYNSDFVIKVKKSDTGEWVEMKAHKNILGSRSTIFERMLDTEMTESKTATLEIVDLSPECVKLILKWIYTGILDEGWKQIPEEVVKAGDKYGLTRLIQFLDASLHHACNFENAISLRGIAKLHGLVTATKNVTKFIAENLDGILD